MNKLFLFFSIKDPLELSKSNSVAFLYRCESSYVNCKRIFVELKWHATDEQNNALTPADNISATMPAAHSLIDSGKHIVRLLTSIKPYRISYSYPISLIVVSVNIGQCQLDLVTNFNQLISKWGNINHYSDAARATFLK